jgi:hypothetical protein
MTMRRFMLWAVSDSNAMRMIERQTGEWVRFTKPSAI